jgi:hypothetical protein
VELALAERPSVYEQLDEQLGTVLHEFLICCLRDQPRASDCDSAGSDVREVG